VAVDPATFATSLDGVFAGGDILRGRDERSPIRAMSDGRRAAISIDRYLQKVSLSAARNDDGGCVSCLYTNTAGVAPLPAKVMDDPAAGYSLLEAKDEAGRCIQCECMECVKSCEYLRTYGRYPRKYLREIYNNLSIVKGERKSNQFINSCSLCGLCAEICPEGLGMAPVVKRARETMVAQNRMPPSAHDFALRDMAFSNGDNFALARNRPHTESSDVVFFPGCQLAGSVPEQVEQVYAYLCEKLGPVGLVLRCCGAPADWAGRTDLFQAGMAALAAEIARLGATTVVTACSSCFKVFTANLPRVKTVSLWEIYEQHGLPPEAEARGAVRPPAVVAVHDPCSTRHEAQLQESARAIIRRLGYTIEELPLNRARTECCSYGGVMWLANRPLAEAVVQRRIAASPADYVTYCSVCRDFFAARGKPALHLLDMIYAPDPAAQAQRASPDFSQRHENRARLKRRLLKQLWGETMDGTQPGYAGINLVMSDEVRARMERRLILVEDIQRVIDQAERTGQRLRDPGTGHLLAYFKPTAVTYWVEYAPEGEVFVVYNAYSHRMEITEGETA
jgi:Fe-S oxidoreductase